MKNIESSNHLAEYKRLTVEMLTTASNTTVYHIKQTQGAEFGREAENVMNVFGAAIEYEFSTLQTVLDRHFKDETTVYFHQSDYHKAIEGDTYLRYHMRNGYVVLYMGSESGEVCVLATKDAGALDRLIKIIKFAY